uniref:YbaB/EbfC family DNA-binding protein n=2 Tax=unclassified Mycobacterium TaxID=2642494 RepID=A0A5Q5BTC3_MYCSS
MDIPLHPRVATEITRGRDFLDRIRSARRAITGLKVTVACPDGDNEIVFAGDGMVADATFAEDVFDRYRGDKLSELLLAMSEEGYAQVSTKVTAEVASVLENR